jgi:hypothetical protein
MEQRWDDIQRGKRKNSEENPFHFFFVNTSRHPRLKYGLCGGKPVSNYQAVSEMLNEKYTGRPGLFLGKSKNCFSSPPHSDRL